eukprot:scaffold2272_cov21-Tisochrysis_lutea.AAC.2
MMDGGQGGESELARECEEGKGYVAVLKVYAVTEGRYSFRLEVPDRAGNVMERDHMVVVDMRPPVSK